MATGSILVTGGAGYVGTHTVVELLNSGYDVIVMDNLVNASMESLKRVNEITGKTVQTCAVDLLNKDGLRDIFKKNKIYCVMHFAGLKAVGESCEKPLLYYKTNVGGTVNLLEVMKEFEVYNIIFSSSATVYGSPNYLPIDEKHPTGGCTNAYGKTKYFIEEILKDICTAEKQWNVILLRYFNPVGSHASGKIGEDPQGIPNNLMPFISQVAVGRRKELTVYGTDYDTPDGTGVRDYIHVVDLAQGHVAALKHLEKGCGCKVYNLGTGKGYSVLDMAKAFEKASGKPIPYVTAGRRAGDIASCYSDASLAKQDLGWEAKLDLAKMCEDLWRWQSNNPNGFRTEGSS
ncbi:UDP-glucose 4-epimerase-like [Mercenaria mercenaria]|uniref:UDP-glucose 4-epimerase-like n=1 Tax=Mercenaria mercenaria TaxID=6596 RepID=UPI00234ED1C0|nr:UDP-glucose 4-epimerase-like [Mercenaria mercenaria]